MPGGVVVVSASGKQRALGTGTFRTARLGFQIYTLPAIYCQYSAVGVESGLLRFLRWWGDAHCAMEWQQIASVERGSRSVLLRDRSGCGFRFATWNSRWLREFTGELAMRGVPISEVRSTFMSGLGLARPPKR